MTKYYGYNVITEDGDDDDDDHEEYHDAIDDSVDVLSRVVAVLTDQFYDSDTGKTWLIKRQKNRNKLTRFPILMCKDWPSDL